MENIDDGADTMVILNMEVEKRILLALINLFEPPTGPVDNELAQMRYEAQTAIGRWMFNGFTGASYEMQGAMRHVVGQMVNAHISPYDSAEAARYSMESAIETITRRVIPPIRPSRY